MLRPCVRQNSGTMGPGRIWQQNRASLARASSIVVRIALAVPPALLLSGCGLAQFPVLDPHGIIASTERNLLFIAAGLMLLVIVPVWIMAFWFAWRYRASNTRARYTPDWSYSASLDAVVWLVPTLIVCCIAYLVWVYTHRLDPYKPLASTVTPVVVDVVAEDWKWLFIYPKQNIAAVNELVFPAARPLALKITSDTVMNSFYIPGLGGQIFAMAGMLTELHLKADGPAQFIGRNTQYSGAGFAGFPEQYFSVRAVSASTFDAWITAAKQSQQVLDAATYAAFAKPGGKVPVHYYSAVEPGLFDHIIAKYTGSRMPRTSRSAALVPDSSGGH